MNERATPAWPYGGPWGGGGGLLLSEVTLYSVTMCWIDGAHRGATNTRTYPAPGVYMGDLSLATLGISWGGAYSCIRKTRENAYA